MSSNFRPIDSATATSNGPQDRVSVPCYCGSPPRISTVVRLGLWSALPPQLLQHLLVIFTIFLLAPTISTTIILSCRRTLPSCIVGMVQTCFFTHPAIERAVARNFELSCTLSDSRDPTLLHHRTLLSAIGCSFWWLPKEQKPRSCGGLSAHQLCFEEIVEPAEETKCIVGRTK